MVPFGERVASCTLDCKAYEKMFNKVLSMSNGVSQRTPVVISHERILMSNISGLKWAGLRREKVMSHVFIHQKEAPNCYLHCTNDASTLAL